MLSERYRNDSRNIVPLSKAQLAVRDKINQKILNGEYAPERISCCICHKKEFEALSEKDRYGINISVVICKSCGQVQSNPRMNQNSYHQFYNGEYRVLYADNHGANEIYFNIERKRGKKIYYFLQEHLSAGLKGKFIVEIGCGVGGILSYFKDKGNKVYGVDLGGENVVFARNKELAVDIGSSEKLQNLKPDIVIFSHTLEHMLDPERELSQLKELLDPGTLVFVALPGIKNLYQSHEQDFLKYLEFPHAYHYTKTTLSNLFHKEGGFKIIFMDEKIEALLQIDQEAKKKTYLSDYRPVLEFLQRLEKNKKYLCKYMIKAKSINFLKKVGVYPTIRNTYFKLRNYR